MPNRVRVKGDYFHGVVPEGSVYVGRAAPGLPASVYANPFVVGQPIGREGALWHYVAGTLPRGANGLAEITLLRAEDATGCYSAWFYDQPHLLLNAAEQLGGRDLCCWCPVPPPGQPDHCHAAWLLEVVADLVSTPDPEPTWER